MSDTLPKTFEKAYTVTDDLAVHFMGGEAPPVLSTPALLLWMEMTSRESIKELLGTGQDTVGIGVTLKHLAATPVGAQVRVVSRLLKIEGRIYSLEIEAFDETEKIGEATHQRAAVTITKFAERVRAKMMRA
jgi:predicted thioesterase